MIGGVGASLPKYPNRISRYNILNYPIDHTTIPAYNHDMKQVKPPNNKLKLKQEPKPPEPPPQPVPITEGTEDIPAISDKETEFITLIYSGTPKTNAFRQVWPERCFTRTGKPLANCTAVANEVLRKKNVAEWIAIMRVSAMQNGMLTHKQYNELLMQSIEDARDDRNHGAVASHLKTLGKSMGFLTDRLHITDDRVKLVEQISRLDSVDPKLAAMFKQRFRIQDKSEPERDVIEADIVSEEVEPIEMEQIEHDNEHQ